MLKSFGNNLFSLLSYPCYLKSFRIGKNFSTVSFVSISNSEGKAHVTAARIMIGNSNCFPKNCITIILLLIMQMYWVLHFELKVYKFIFGKYFGK